MLNTIKQLFSGGAIQGVANAVDMFHTSDEERLKAKLDERELELGAISKIHDTNITEAKHKNIFVSGWRSNIGWACGAAIWIYYVIWPMVQAGSLVIATWPDYEQIAKIEWAASVDDLYPLIVGMLGLGTIKAVERRMQIKK